MYSPSVSFCIITNGLRPQSLHATISSIRSLNIPDYEIIVGGEVPGGFSDTSIKVVPVISAAREGRLGEMRNRIKAQATKSIIVICDDDLCFQADFYIGLCDFGPNFDIQCVKFLNPDGSRYWDWAVVNSPDGHHLIDYSENSEYVYITGGLCILNSKIKEKIDWPEHNGFYEAEDVYFTKIVREMGFRIDCNPSSTVVHDDPRMSQIEDFALRVDSPNKWQLHPSGLLIKGANPGSPKFFSIRKQFEIEVPISELTKNRVLTFGVSQFGELKQYLNQTQCIKIRYLDSVIDQFTFSPELTNRVLSFELPKSSTPIKFIIEAEEEVLSSWYHHPRDRAFVAGMIFDLKLDQEIEIDFNTLHMKKERLELLKKKNDEESLYRTKKGLTLSVPFAIGNPITRTIRSLIKNLSENCKFLSIEPKICEKRILGEIQLSKFENDLWLRIIKENSESVSYIEFSSDYLGDIDQYKSSLVRRRNEAADNIYFIDPSKNNVYKDGLFGVELESQDQKYFLPFSIDTKSLSAKFNPSIPKSTPEHTLIGLDVDKDELEYLPNTLKILSDLNLTNKIELIIFSSEIKSNRVGVELGQIVQNICEKHDINPDLLPNTICLNEIPDDRDVCEIYKSLDLLVQIKSNSNFSYKLLPLAMSCRVFTFEKSEYSVELTENEVICVNESTFGEQLQKHISYLKGNSHCEISKFIVEKYDSEKISKIWVDVINKLGNIERKKEFKETKIIELSSELLSPSYDFSKSGSSRISPTLLLDMRSIFGFEENLVRGIGKYSLSHASTLIKKYPEWNFYILVNDHIYFNRVESILPYANARPESLCNPSGQNFDLMLVYDPMGNGLGYHNPFLIYPEVPHSAILYDLIPLEEKNHFDVNDHKQIAAYNVALKYLESRKPHLLSISNYSKDVAIDLLQYDPNLIDVINGAPALPFLDLNKHENLSSQPKWDSTNQIKPFFMTVGSLEPRKNFHCAFSSFISALAKVDIELLVVGSLIDPYKIYYENELNRQGLNNIKFIGLLSDEELFHCYSNSKGLLFLSQFEGLGLPPIEAMRYGCPVITSNQSCLPETVGPKGLIFNPSDSEGISRAMVSLVTDNEFRKSVIKNGIVQVSRYTWDNTIEETVRAWAKNWEVFQGWSGKEGSGESLVALERLE